MEQGTEIEITETHSGYTDSKTLRYFNKGERYIVGETIAATYAELICGDEKKLAKVVSPAKPVGKKAGA